MKEVILNGFIGDKYGRTWNIKANTIKDVVSCINANYPSFKKDILDYTEAGGGFDIECGSRLIEDEEDLLYTISEDSVVITPIPGGGKSGGAKLLLAAALVATFFIPGAQGATGFLLTTGGEAGASLTIAGNIVALTAANLALTGLMQIMAPDPSVDQATNENYLFKGPQNTVPQNNIVPVLFGKMIIGGAIIASGTVTGVNLGTGLTYLTGVTDTDGGTGGTSIISPLPGGTTWIPLTDLGIRI